MWVQVELELLLSSYLFLRMLGCEWVSSPWFPDEEISLGLFSRCLTGNLWLSLIQPIFVQTQVFPICTGFILRLNCSLCWWTKILWICLLISLLGNSLDWIPASIIPKVALLGSWSEVIFLYNKWSIIFPSGWVLKLIWSLSPLSTSYIPLSLSCGLLPACVLLLWLLHAHLINAEHWYICLWGIQLGLVRYFMCLDWVEI